MITAAVVIAAFLALAFAAWRRYLWAAEGPPQKERSPYALTEEFGPYHLDNVPHQKGVRWLNEVFNRTAKKFPDHTALQIPSTGESLTYAELDSHAEAIAAAISPFVTGPDQIVAVAMPQDNWQIVASHLAILKAGGTLMFIDATLPESLIDHMLEDARPVLVLTRGEAKFRDMPTVDVLDLPAATMERRSPTWLDDPSKRLAAIFYTSGTTGKPRGVECPHAGYVNLALSYADYFDLVPGIDATSLTSSLGYDGSISEMYSAWVSGCAVVLLTKDEVRSGPDLVPILNEAEVTVLFCPPVLLTTLTQSPENDLPYPICRYIVPAGEVFPNALVEPWTRNRRQIINTYGPTEASTDTSRQSLRPGEPITIGSPFPNVTYVILEIDGLDPLPLGSEGELCIGGVHVARGYRNLPDQTEAKFIVHHEFGRLYRTGDKAFIDPATSRVHFLGRIDAQLKVRGHRVEAQAVEDILQTQFHEIEAAVLDYQNEALVAFVSAPSVAQIGIDVAAAPSEWADRVTATLSTQLPGPSVPDRIFLVEKFVMKPLSGKIDRRCLPDLSLLLTDTVPSASTHWSGDDTSPEEGPSVDGDLGRVLVICRDIFETPLGLDDEFAFSGGHSIAIARLAQKLQGAGWQIGVRDLLSDSNTVRKIVMRPRKNGRADDPFESTLPSSNDTKPIVRDEAAARTLPVHVFTTLQVLFAVLLYLPGIIALMVVAGEGGEGLPFIPASLADFVIAGFLLYLLILALPFAGLVWVMIIKSFIGGDASQNNITPGLYPKWSRMHLRVWCIGRLENMVLVPIDTLFRSAPLRAFVLRRLGAEVGKNLQCAQGAVLTGPLDLLSIGDDVAIQTGAYVQTTQWAGQFLQIGRVRLDTGCKIGMRACVSGDVTIGRGGWITPFTPVLENVGPNEVVEGAPAKITGRCAELERSARACEPRRPIWLLETYNLAMQIGLTLLLRGIPIAVILWLASRFLLAFEPAMSGADVGLSGLFEFIWHLAVYAFVTTWITTVVTSLLSCIFIRMTAGPPGLYPTRGLRAALMMYRVNRMNAVQGQWTWTITGQYLRALAGVRFPRVGGSECDVMFNLVPETCSADSQVFWSNGCFTNMLDYGANHITLRRLDMPRNFYTGNNCVAEYGQFPPNFLLGVSTPASDIEFRRGMRNAQAQPITIAGNPPVRFASSTLGGDAESDRPTFFLFAARVFLNDVFSIGVLPIAEGLIFTIAYILFARSTDHALAIVAALVATEAGLIGLSVTIKKLIVGSRWGKDDTTPFWSLRHFAYFFAQDCFFVWCRESMRFLGGTLAANSILRMMGCTIGKRTIVTQPMLCFDWNAVDIGDDGYFDGMLQLHTFENRVLKVKRMEIAERAAVNTGATVMGGAVLEENTTIEPLSLVLKEMHLEEGVHEGSPAGPRNISFEPPKPVALSRRSNVVDNTDWIKAAAIILVLIDHTGYFMMESDKWWGAFGRLAAPTFFFLLGYAKTRRVPIEWILLGVTLTLLESANNDWTWVAPNILLSFAVIRLGRPYVEKVTTRLGFAGYVIIALLLVALLPAASPIFDYGAEGWLWALFGMSQRIFVDGRQEAGRGEKFKSVIGRGLLAILVAAVYVSQEQKEFQFSQDQLTVVIIGVAIMTLIFFVFSRGKARLQLGAKMNGVLCFIGRNTLAIYAIELLAFEILVMLVPALRPD
jgi:non-ribosomal peptide synthetase-like protein